MASSMSVIAGVVDGVGVVASVCVWVCLVVVVGDALFDGSDGGLHMRTS